MPRCTIRVGKPTTMASSCPVATSSSIAIPAAASKSRSTQNSPARSSGTPTSTTGIGNEAATGTRSSWARVLHNTVAPPGAPPRQSAQTCSPLVRRDEQHLVVLGSNRDGDGLDERQQTSHTHRDVEGRDKADDLRA